MAKKKKPLQKARIISYVCFLLFFLVLLSFCLYNIYFSGLIYPKTTIAGISVSRKSPMEASEVLSKSITAPKEIVLVAGDEKFNINLEDIGFAYNFEASAKNAFALTRTGNIFSDFIKRASSLFNKSEVLLSYRLDENKLREVLSVIDSQVSSIPVYPAAKLVRGVVQIERGTAGSELDKENVTSKIYEMLSRGKGEKITLPLKTVDPTINEQEAEALKLRSEKIVDKNLTLNFEFQNFTFSGQELLNFLGAKGGYNDKEIQKVTSDIAGKINRQPQDPTFIFENGRVSEFAPSKDGVNVKEDTLKGMISGNLTTLEVSDEVEVALTIPVDKIPSKIKTEEVNNLGIKELLGRGDSSFTHSIPNRIYNIGLASSRFKGVLIKPGEIFSFNDVLGDVSSYTGYKQAFVIKDGKTVLGDGGGVCQVSSTLFRAALNAGLPIIERRPHSYRVGYYEQNSPPGLDATVFAPSADLKFQNDTPGHLLIQPAFDGKNQTLVFEIYGTDDGRVATITQPKISRVSAAPPDLYVDDPTLPSGTIKQIDFKASGASVSFDYKVTRNGADLYSKTFISNYRPWQAVYLRGTGVGL